MGRTLRGTSTTDLVVLLQCCVVTRGTHQHQYPIHRHDTSLVLTIEWELAPQIASQLHWVRKVMTLVSRFPSRRQEEDRGGRKKWEKPTSRWTLRLVHNNHPFPHRRPPHPLQRKRNTLPCFSGIYRRPMNNTRFSSSTFFPDLDMIVLRKYRNWPLTLNRLDSRSLVVAIGIRSDHDIVPRFDLPRIQDTVDDGTHVRHRPYGMKFQCVEGELYPPSVMKGKD